MVVDLVGMVKQAGVVGAGGAGFPTHVKLAAKVELIIVNGAECEPLLHVDQELIKAYAPELTEALQASMAATGAKCGVFALKEKYTAARAALEKAIAGKPGLSVSSLQNNYPAGDEHVLVHEVTGQVVPEGGIPLNVSVVVINVETLYNVGKALKGVPVTETFLTVTGAVANPATLRVPVGTTVREVLAAAGGPTESDSVVINGGPLMGSVLTDLDAPVSKVTKGLVVLPAIHPHAARANTPIAVAAARAGYACCQCRQCTDLCPRHLLGHHIEPHKAMRALGYGLVDDLDTWTSAFLCSECGVCDTFACPAGLSPRAVFRTIKGRLAKAGVKNPHKAVPVPLAERPYRRVPADRLVWRAGLAAYNVGTPLQESCLQPEFVKVPLKQNAGAPSVATVKPGDTVVKGQPVAEPPAGALGAVHHASISGKVVAVANEVVIRRGA